MYDPWEMLDRDDPAWREIGEHPPIESFVTQKDSDNGNRSGS